MLADQMLESMFVGDHSGVIEEGAVNSDELDTSFPQETESIAARLAISHLALIVIARPTDYPLSPYNDGTTLVVLSPLDFIGRLAALVPRPRVNLTRFHGVFSPNSKLREHVVPKRPPVQH